MAISKRRYRVPVYRTTVQKGYVEVEAYDEDAAAQIVWELSPDSAPVDPDHGCVEIVDLEVATDEKIVCLSND